MSASKGDYHVFVHLLDDRDHLRVAGGGRQALVDNRFWPTSRWLGNAAAFPSRDLLGLESTAECV